jgi:hypothetical protein
MKHWEDFDSLEQAIMQEQIAYAFRYWVSLDPATRSRYLHPTISLDSLDFEINAEVAPAFIAWLQFTTITKVNELSGWNDMERNRR